MDISLTGRSAIVTGSVRRIGQAIAMELARNGAAVMINSRSDEAAARGTAEAIIAAGGRAVWCVADVTVPADVRRMVDQTLAAFGGLDILVNNAAVRPNAPFGEVSLESWRQTLSVVLDGAFLCAQAALPHICTSPAGRIVSIGGAGAHIGVKNRSHVSTAKAGLLGLTRSLATEFAGQLTANTVVPGMIEDEDDDGSDLAARRKRVPIDKVLVGHSGRPRDIAQVVAFLASAAGTYINGQTIHVSGGLHLT